VPIEFAAASWGRLAGLHLRQAKGTRKNRQKGRCVVAIVDIDVQPSTGTFDATIKDPQGAPGGPFNVINYADEWRVDCEWSVAGDIAQDSGTWRVQVALEGLGGPLAPEGTLRAADEPMIPGQTSYATKVVFPARLIDPGPDDTWAFHVAALLTNRDAANNPRPVGAMVDLGVVQIYKSSP
jgi:hypothetical protein